MRAPAALLLLLLVGLALAQADQEEEFRNPAGTPPIPEEFVEEQVTRSETFTFFEYTRIDRVATGELQLLLEAPAEADAFVVVIGPDHYVERRKGTGMHLFENLEAGYQLVVASGDGLALTVGTLPLHAGERAVVELELRPLDVEAGDRGFEALGEVEVALGEAERETGEIYVENDVIGATMVVVGNDGYYVVSYGNQRFDLDDLEPGSYVVAGTFEGHEAGGVLVELAPGGAAELDFELPKLGIPH